MGMLVLSAAVSVAVVRIVRKIFKKKSAATEKKLPLEIHELREEKSEPIIVQTLDDTSEENTILKKPTE
ncbi:MAG: hypothetical protein R3Y26_10590 [Rikenellaceae bacterium]